MIDERSNDKIEKWFILRKGLWQDDRKVTGLENLWLKSRAFSNRCCCIQCREWDDDPIGMANMIWRNSTPDPIIYDISYSAGGGHGMPALAKALQERGLFIDTAVMCDPVDLSTLVFMHWRSLINRGPLAPKIIIPPNVRKIIWFRQKHNKPQGHDIVCKGDTKIVGPTWINAGHSFMDERQEFHDAALNLLRNG